MPGQPSPRFHVEAWLPFSNREMVSTKCYSAVLLIFFPRYRISEMSKVLMFELFFKLMFFGRLMDKS